MRRLICVLLILSILLPLFGCTGKSIESPVSFYYLRRTYNFGSGDSIITPELVDGSQFSDISPMLSSYLQGPSDLTLESPFPAGTYLLDTKTSDDLLIITLSNNFASLSGIALTLACCTLAKTAMEFSGVESVQIRAATALLDGDESITIHANDIFLYDNYMTASTGSTQ